MLNNHLQACSVKKMLDPVSAANTAAATSPYITTSEFEGDVEVIVSVGAITGSFTPTFEDATDTGGTGSAAVVPNEGAIGAMTANTAVKRTFSSAALRQALRVVGTIVTGPTLVSVVMQAHPKYTT